MTPEEARLVWECVHAASCCGVEAKIGVQALEERFPDFPWREWYAREYGEPEETVRVVLFTVDSKDIS